MHYYFFTTKIIKNLNTCMMYDVCTCMHTCILLYVYYAYVQLGSVGLCRTQKLNPEKNIYFHMLPSIPLEIAHRDTSKSGERKTLCNSFKS